jgi:hypothetical protein
LYCGTVWFKSPAGAAVWLLISSIQQFLVAVFTREMLSITRQNSMSLKLLRDIRRRQMYLQSGTARALSITCRGA